MLVYVGNMSGDPETSGVHVCRFENGRLEILQFAPQARPSFLALSATRRLLFAASHVPFSDDRPGGNIAAYAIGEQGHINLLGSTQLPITHPAFIKLDRSERFIMAACTLGGGVAVLPITETGVLGAPASVQMHPGRPLIPPGETVSPLKGKGMEVPEGYSMPHSIGTDPHNLMAIAPDKADKIMVYGFDEATGGLTPVQRLDCPPGSGPRHHVFHPSRPLAFVLNENNASLGVFSYDVEAREISPLGAVPTLPEDAAGPNLCADITFGADGRYLYCSNRGHDSVAIFAVIEDAPFVVPMGWCGSGGREPRHIAVTPDGVWLLAANVASDEVCGFRIEAESGRLQPAPEAHLAIKAPSCVAVLA